MSSTDELKSKGKNAHHLLKTEFNREKIIEKITGYLNTLQAFVPRFNDVAMLTGESDFQSLNKKLNYAVRIP